MFDLLQSLIKYIQLPSTGLRPMLGEQIVGNQTKLGPFLGVAPEQIGDQTEKPYMVYDTVSAGLDQGFGGAGRSYGEKPLIRFHLFDANADRLTKNLEFFIGTMDTIPFVELSPKGTDVPTTLIRKDTPILLNEPVGRTGKRVYHAVIPYEFRVARVVGTSGLPRPQPVSGV